MRLKSTGMGYFLAISDAVSLLNLVSGFIAILMVIDNHLTIAALCVLLAIVFDSADGWVARKLEREDSFGFGKNIDSLADIVSFGVAPSVILYYLGSGISPWTSYLIAIVSIFALVCGILRLTRYNVIADRINYRGFIGFPIPGTALILVTYYLSGLFNLTVAAILMLFAGYLMISTIRYPKFDNMYIIGIGALMIVLLLLPINIVIAGINIPALILFIFALIYMFVTFLEFFMDTEDPVFDKDNASRKVSHAKEITEDRFSISMNHARDKLKTMKDTINQVSSEDFNIGNENNNNENKVNNKENDIGDGININTFEK